MRNIRFFVIVFPFALFFINLAIYLTVKRWKSGKIGYFLGYLICGAGVLIGNFVELKAQSTSASVLACRVTYIFLAFIGVFFFLFTREWTLHAKPSNRALLPFLSIIPVATVVLQFTNDYHGLVWETYHFVPIGGYLINSVDVYGPWFWVHVIHSYGLMSWGILILAKESSGQWWRYKTRSLLIALATFIPSISNALYIGRPEGIAVWDVSSAFFCLSGLFFSVAITKYDFIHSPPSRSSLMDTSGVGFTIVDEKGVIVDINRLAMGHFGFDRPPIGKPSAEYLPALAPAFMNMREPNSAGWREAIALNGRELIVAASRREETHGGGIVIISSEVAQWAGNGAGSVSRNASIPEPYLKADESWRPLERLSKRERELFEDLLGPLLNKEIVLKWNISPETLKTHIRHINKKLGCENREELRARYGAVAGSAAGCAEDSEG